MKIACTCFFLGFVNVATRKFKVIIRVRLALCFWATLAQLDCDTNGRLQSGAVHDLHNHTWQACQVWISLPGFESALPMSLYNVS